MAARRSNIIVQIFRSLFNSFQGIGNLFSRSTVKKRHNPEFEKAGQEVRLPPTVDRKSTAQINRATMERDLEVLNAMRQEKKVLRKKGPEADQYRKAKEVDNVDVSRGVVISHLAAMQRKASEKKKAEKEILRKEAEAAAQQNGEHTETPQSDAEQNASDD